MPGSFACTDGTNNGIVTPAGDAQAAGGLFNGLGMLYNGATYDRIREVIGDAQAAAGIQAIAEMMFNGATYERRRTPNVYKTVSAVAITAATGTTAWDPASGKKFRLMGFCGSVSAAAFKIYEGLTTALTNLLFLSPLIATAGNFSIVFPGNGIVSSTADMNLNLDVSANATVTGTFYGTEE